MKIALVSDTHGVCRKELFDHIKKCDYLIHTGDFDNERTYNRFLNCGIPMYAVRGNCDHGEWASYLHEFLDCRSQCPPALLRYQQLIQTSCYGRDDRDKHGIPDV